LIPLLAAGSTPLLKVKSISQSIDTNNLIIDNSTTLSSPFADFSFSATASFEVRSPSRIEVTKLTNTSLSIKVTEALTVCTFDYIPVNQTLPLKQSYVKKVSL